MKTTPLRTLPLALLLTMLTVAMPLAAKDKKAPAMNAEQQAMLAAWQKAGAVGPQHKQLEALVGNWTTKQSMWMDPKAPPMKETGRSNNTLVMGGRYLRQDFSSRWGGQPFHGMGYMGYDNVTGKHFSSWMDDGSTSLFLAHGTYDPATKTYTYNGEMNDPMQGGAKVPTRTTLRLISKDKHVMEMHETRNGKEARTMQIEYTRVGK